MGAAQQYYEQEYLSAESILVYKLKRIMKLTTLLTTQLLGLVAANPHVTRQDEDPHNWIPGGPNDCIDFYILL